MSFSFAPQGWAKCDGQLLPINQNQALFSILGTTYGGNGQVNFGLPNLKGRSPAHVGSGLTLGEQTGTETHTLSTNEIPAHTHQLNGVAPANSGGNVNNPTGNYLSNSAPAEIYKSSGTGILSPVSATITNSGGGQSHTNMQPYLVLNFCIALQGIYPSQN